MRQFADHRLGGRQRYALALALLMLAALALVAGPLSQPATAKTVAQSASAATSQTETLSPASIAARQKFFGYSNVDPTTGAVDPNRVIMSWTGVGTFAASFMGHVVLLDDWIPRAATPGGTWGHNLDYVGATPAEYAALAPEAYLIGHLHNDHGGDAPGIVIANPNVPVYGAANHCDDIKAWIEANHPSTQFNCFALFPATPIVNGTPPSSYYGQVNNLPANVIPGVSISVLTHPHSSTAPAGDPPFDTEQVDSRKCDAYTDFPPDGEPATYPGWTPPPSGIVSQAWQFRIGNFSLAWEDTDGYEAGTKVSEAWASLPSTDVLYGAIAVSGRSVLNEQIDEIRPKVFIPIHHDPCAYDVYGEVVNQLDTIPASLRPKLDFISDPGDYLRPEVYDPTAAVWAQNSNPAGTGLEPTSTPVPNPGPRGASPEPTPTPAPTSAPSSTSTQVPTATVKAEGYMPSGTASEVGVAVATNTKSAASIASTTTNLVVELRKAMGTRMTVKVLGVPAAGKLKLALSARNGKRTVSVGSVSRTLKAAAKSVTFRLRLSKAARALIAARSKTKATLKLSYKPVGANSQSVQRSVTISR